MKEKVEKEYYKWVRAALKSKLNGRNVINAINIWTEAIVRCGTLIINWNKGQLDKIDRQTLKQLNMHRGLHPHFCDDRLCIPRDQRGWGFLSLKYCIELESSNLFDYAANNKERLLKAATEELQLRKKIDGKNKVEGENERLPAWKEKAFHGQFQTRRQWLKVGELKWETDSLTSAAQEQALIRNVIKMALIIRTWSPIQALKRETWKCNPYCQFIFCPS